MGALDGYLMRCGYPDSVGRQSVPLFPAVYGGYVALFAHGWGYRDPRSWIIESTRMLVWGAQLGSVSSDVLLKPENKRGLEFLRHMLRVREAATKWIACGEMRSAPRIEGTIPTVRYGRNDAADIDAVQTAVWLSPGRESAAVLFVNASDRESVAFDWRLNARQCGLPTADRYRLRPMIANKDAGSQTVSLPGPLLHSRLNLGPWRLTAYVLEPMR